MGSFTEQYKIALVASLEIVLMSLSNTKYHLMVAKLNSIYDLTLGGCYEHPEYLKDVLKEVYPEDYDYIISEVKARLDELVNEPELMKFFEVMES